MKTRKALAVRAAVLALVLLTVSCNPGFLADIWDDFLTPVLDVTPSQAVLEPAQQVVLQAQGGRGPYEFALRAGFAGALTDYGDGTALYTAPAGAADDTIRVTDDRGAAMDVDIQVTPLTLLRILPETVPPETISLGYGQSLALGHTGGAAPYVFTLAAGTGSLVDNGGGTALYTAPLSDTDAVVQVEDAVGQAAQTSITVRAGPAPLSISPASVTMEEGTVYTFTASGGNPLLYTFMVSGGSITNTGTGTEDFTAPAAPVVVTVTVTDGDGATAVAAVTVVPAAGTPLTIVPSSINVSFGASFQFTAEGGEPWVPSLPDPPYYTYAMGTSYGGTVTADGLYTAPTDRQGVETVVVTDSRGITDTATIKVKKK